MKKVKLNFKEYYTTKGKKLYAVYVGKTYIGKTTKKFRIDSDLSSHKWV
jgi:hypothetical protein